MKIALIEDSIFFQKALSSVFKASTEISSIEVFSEGARALSWMETNPVDLVIVDLEMPGMSGEELIEKIRITNKNIPIIIFSAEGRKSAIRVLEAFKMGASDFVTKGGGDSLNGGFKKIRMFYYLKSCSLKTVITT